MYKVSENKDDTVDIFYGRKLIKKFYPNFDLEKSAQLLSEFNNLIDINGDYLHSRWSHNGFFIIPAIQNLLYWDYFVGIVAYKDLHDFLRDKKFKITVPRFYVNGRLQRMHNLLYGRTSLIKRIIYNFISWFLRKRFKQKHRIFLNDDGYDGFRFRDFKNNLGEIESFHRVENVSFGNILRLFYDRSTLPLGKFSLKSSNINNTYKISDELSKYVSKSSFEDLINAIDSKCLDIILESLDLEKVLDFNKADMFLTYDETETCNAMLLSSRFNSLKTIAYQHGPFSNFHSGWIGYGIDPQFCNLKADQIIVWGKYWKNFLSKISNKYSDSDILVGAHLNKIIDYHDSNYQITKEINKPLKLLVPYEFLANNIEISAYLEKFLDMNIKITIKLRPQGDGDIQSDLYSYSKSIQDNADFVYDLKDTELRSFDAVICTQSIFSVEMMRFNTPIWYLETSVPFLKNIADDGYAYHMKLKEVKSFKNEEDIYKYLKPKYNVADYMDIFTNKNLKEQIKEIINKDKND